MTVANVAVVGGALALMGAIVWWFFLWRREAQIANVTASAQEIFDGSEDAACIEEAAT